MFGGELSSSDLRALLGLDIVETQIVAEHAFASSSAFMRFKVPQAFLLLYPAEHRGTPLLQGDRTGSEVQASTSVHSKAETVFPATVFQVWSLSSVEQGTLSREHRSGHQLSQGRRTTVLNTIRDLQCSCQEQGIGQPGSHSTPAWQRALDLDMGGHPLPMWALAGHLTSLNSLS